MRRLFRNVPLLLPRSTTQNSPTFCRLMMQCRREALGDSRTTVFLSERPMEQLPCNRTRSRPGDSSHAPASGKSMEAFYSKLRKRKAFTARRTEPCPCHFFALTSSAWRLASPRECRNLRERSRCYSARVLRRAEAVRSLHAREDSRPWRNGRC